MALSTNNNNTGSSSSQHPRPRKKSVNAVHRPRVSIDVYFNSSGMDHCLMDGLDASLTFEQMFAMLVRKRGLNLLMKQPIDKSYSLNLKNAHNPSNSSSSSNNSSSSSNNNNNNNNNNNSGNSNNSTSGNNSGSSSSHANSNSNSSGGGGGDMVPVKMEDQLNSSIYAPFYRPVMVLHLKPEIPHEKLSPIFGNYLVLTSRNPLYCDYDVYNQPLPRFLKLCFSFISKTGMDTTGIFRVSGALRIVEAFKKRVDTNMFLPVKPDVDPNAITGLVKMYLRELPEPLLTYRLYEPLKKIVSIGDEEDDEEEAEDYEYDDDFDGGGDSVEDENDETDEGSSNNRSSNKRQSQLQSKLNQIVSSSMASISGNDSFLTSVNVDTTDQPELSSVGARRSGRRARVRGRISAVRRLINTIPLEHYAVLEHLMALCNLMIKYKQETKMTHETLSIVIGPNIMVPPLLPDQTEDTNATLQDTPLICKVASFLILHYSRLFRHNSPYDTELKGYEELSLDPNNKSHKNKNSSSHSSLSSQSKSSASSSKKIRGHLPRAVYHYNNESLANDCQYELRYVRLVGESLVFLNVYAVDTDDENPQRTEMDNLYVEREIPFDHISQVELIEDPYHSLYITYNFKKVPCSVYISENSTSSDEADNSAVLNPFLSVTNTSIDTFHAYLTHGMNRYTQYVQLANSEPEKYGVVISKDELRQAQKRKQERQQQLASASSIETPQSPTQHMSTNGLGECEFDSDSDDSISFRS